MENEKTNDKSSEYQSLRNEDYVAVSVDNGLENHTHFSSTENLIPNDEEDDDISSLEKSTKVTRIKLEWKNLTVNAKIPPPSCFSRLRKKSSGPTSKEILKDVNGVVKPGSLLAIMGASGAGKTTLLNVLSYQNMSQLEVEGSVLVNGKNIEKSMKYISGYIQQESVFIGTLTVKEHLTFQALLRMGKRFTTEEKKERVAYIMEQFGLTKCKDTIIGVPGRLRGISGGENKRLMFASEIITNPPLLFADEPTSGLDAYMAESVITALKKLADEGRTIIATIHQPSSQVFQLFDRLLLMAEGQIAYMGTTKGAMEFYDRIGYPCPMNYNPADHYVQTLAIIPGKVEECREKAKAICGTFLEEKKLEEKIFDGEDNIEDVKVIKKQSYKVNCWKQFMAVLWRAWNSNRREPFIGSIRISQSVIIALIAGLIYFQQDNTSKGAGNINGAIFYSVTSLTFSSLGPCLFVFPAELPVFLKEHKQGMYRTGVYFISKQLAELPWYVFATGLFSIIAYWMIGFRTEFVRFLIFFGLCQLCSQCALSYGYLVSVLSPTVQVAQALGTALLMPFLLFGGFYLKDESIPVYFIWLKWLSWFKYANENIEINQWDGFGSIDCQGQTTGCLPNGKAVLQFNGYSADNFNRNLGLMCALIVGFRTIAFLVMLVRAKRAR